MKTYEMIHEISDMCRGKMDSDISEIQTDNLDEYMKSHISRAATCEKTELESGAIVYDVVTNGLKERFSFTEISSFFENMKEAAGSCCIKHM